MKRSEIVFMAICIAVWAFYLGGVFDSWVWSTGRFSGAQYHNAVVMHEWRSKEPKQ